MSVRVAGGITKDKDKDKDKDEDKDTDEDAEIDKDTDLNIASSRPQEPDWKPSVGIIFESLDDAESKIKNWALATGFNI